MNRDKLLKEREEFYNTNNNKELIKKLAHLFAMAENELDNVEEEYDIEEDGYKRSTSKYDVLMEIADKEAERLANLLDKEIGEIIDMTFDF